MNSLDDEIDTLLKVINLFKYAHNQIDSSLMNIHNMIQDNQIGREHLTLFNNLTSSNNHHMQHLSNHHSNTSDLLVEKQTLLESNKKHQDTCKQLLEHNFTNCHIICSFQETNCRICLDDVVFGFKLECNHFFHIECLIKAYIENQLCPLCRKIICF
jgi:hypothetical protein